MYRFHHVFGDHRDLSVDFLAPRSSRETPFPRGGTDEVHADDPAGNDAHTAAVAEADGPEAGLRIVDQLALDDYQSLHSTRAELLRRLGRTAEARAAYRRALALVHDDAERRWLERRLAELADDKDSPPG